MQKEEKKMKNSNLFEKLGKIINEVAQKVSEDLNIPLEDAEQDLWELALRKKQTGTSLESIKKQLILLPWRERKTFKKTEDGFIFNRRSFYYKLLKRYGYHYAETDDELEHPTAMELAITVKTKRYSKEEREHYVEVFRGVCEHTLNRILDRFANFCVHLWDGGLLTARQLSLLYNYHRGTPLNELSKRYNLSIPGVKKALKTAHEKVLIVLSISLERLFETVEVTKHVDGSQWDLEDPEIASVKITLYKELQYLQELSEQLDTISRMKRDKLEVFIFEYVLDLFADTEKIVIPVTLSKHKTKLEEISVEISWWLKEFERTQISPWQEFKKIFNKEVINRIRIPYIVYTFQETVDIIFAPKSLNILNATIIPLGVFAKSETLNKVIHMLITAFSKKEGHILKISQTLPKWLRAIINTADAHMFLQKQENIWKDNVIDLNQLKQLDFTLPITYFLKPIPWIKEKLIDPNTPDIPSVYDIPVTVWLMTLLSLLDDNFSTTDLWELFNRMLDYIELGYPKNPTFNALVEFNFMVLSQSNFLVGG